MCLLSKKIRDHKATMIKQPCNDTQLSPSSLISLKPLFVLKMKQGKLENINIITQKNYGATRVWIKEFYEDLHPLAIGVSEPLYFETATLSFAQHTDDIGESHLNGHFVEITKGTLMVTSIHPDGFYVTDTLSEPDFSHIFAFNFSTPEDILIGDKLKVLSGIITEFNGFTELGFPYWEVDTAKSQLPKSIDILDTIEAVFPALIQSDSPCSENTYIYECAIALERLESALIQLNGVQIQKLQTKDLVDYEEYGQWIVQIPSSENFLVVTRESIPAFDPLIAAGKSIDLVGTLRHLYFGSRTGEWIVEPRDPADCKKCKN